MQPNEEKQNDEWVERVNEKVRKIMAAKKSSDGVIEQKMEC